MCGVFVLFDDRLEEQNRSMYDEFSSLYDGMITGFLKYFGVTGARVPFSRIFHQGF